MAHSRTGLRRFGAVFVPRRVSKFTDGFPDSSGGNCRRGGPGGTLYLCPSIPAVGHASACPRASGSTGGTRSTLRARFRDHRGRGSALFGTADASARLCAIGGYRYRAGPVDRFSRGGVDRKLSVRHHQFRLCGLASRRRACRSLRRCAACPSAEQLRAAHDGGRALYRRKRADAAPPALGSCRYVRVIPPNAHGRS